MISSNYDQVAVNGVNSSTIQKVVSRKYKKYIQKYAAGCSDYFVLKLGTMAVTIENGRNVWRVKKNQHRYSDPGDN